ncbi:MAG TPA: iron-sulfur cluster repair di-iron protein [Sandaracinaceae bacterium]
MTLSAQTTVADIVTAHPECASVLQSHRIDFCCKGELSLEEACRRRGIDPDALLVELERTIAGRARLAGDVRETPTAELVETIVERHHGYLRQALPFLSALSEKVARVHGDHEPRLVEIREIVSALATELSAHLDQEEAELFPRLLEPGASLQPSELEAVRGEHLWIGEQLRRLRTLTDEYVAPEWACRSYRTLFAELEAMETDVLRHVHLENHVLLPRFSG